MVGSLCRIGNYNASRYVELFFTHLKGLHPTDVVVHYFLRDAEELSAGGGNWLLRNSELAVTVWNVVQHHVGSIGAQNLEEHYRNVYDAKAHGFLAMRDALRRLSQYAHENHITLTMAMIPDIHDLKNYKFGYIHQIMSGIAAEDGYRFIDLYPAMADLTPEQVFSLPGDPHPNSLGHSRMAKTIYPILSQQL